MRGEARGGGVGSITLQFYALSLSLSQSGPPNLGPEQSRLGFWAIWAEKGRPI